MQKIEWVRKEDKRSLYIIPIKINKAADDQSEFIPEIDSPESAMMQLMRHQDANQEPLP